LPKCHYEKHAIEGKLNRNVALQKVKAQLMEELGEEYAERKAEISETVKEIQAKIMRSDILEKGIRIDGRKLNEIRSITCETNLLPRTHGSALFSRGETQVLSTLTLGSGPDEQRIETLSGEEARSFMLHYNFPPFSVGEVKRLGGPSRRDMGHGGLAHRALEKVLPSKEDFDYTIRLVSEVLESNGSSSMGTVCSGSLALMDGGVPITEAVSGIAMGLIKEGDQIAVLSDILGDEDHAGDMDFKVAGTKKGITALQMDIKIKELSKEILEKALNQAREGRLHILDKMNEALAMSKKDISPFAPKMIRIRINPDKIRDIIGPGGKIIRAIQAETNTKIEIEDDGTVKIAATNETEGQAALKQIQDITKEAEVGVIYDGVVVKTADFGAFVNILPGIDGLCHISQLTNQRLKQVTDFVNTGDPLRVKVLEISKDGKIRLSHRVLLEEDSAGSENTKNNAE
jgi:polyribonucleotide nucleotidyltransferase